MDYKQISDYYLWTEDRIQEKIDELTDKEFTEIFLKLGWSMRNFVEHLFVVYEWSLDPLGSLQEYDEIAKKMDRKTLMQKWKEASSKFRNELIGSNKEMIQMSVSEKKTLEIKKDDFFFIITDHQTYHRGQMTTILKLIGKEGVKTDFYYFVTLEG
ncbi:MAG: DinB family protein [Candidatus Kariarchaeaceae archaeon]|jgi:uncharacterized damage-inducible protein DinB